MNWYFVTIKTATGLTETWESGDTAAEVIDTLRGGYKSPVSIAARKIFYGEFDCNSFTIAGHVPHANNSNN